MFIINVAEWCVEALVLGLAFLFFAIGTFIFLMLLSIIKQWITGDNNG
tara:strand:- start:727 stop:870 length:144 start_codon:yes stop_codon:yes gene_type:complete